MKYLKFDIAKLMAAFNPSVKKILRHKKSLPNDRLSSRLCLLKLLFI
jgi:hypothetical protein